MKRFDGTNTNTDKFGAGEDGFQDKNAGGGIGGWGVGASGYAGALVGHGTAF